MRATLGQFPAPGPGSSRLAPVRRRIARAYSAGGSLDDALVASRRLARHRFASIVGYAARPDESPRAVADAYLAAFEALSAEQLDCYVSVKLSALAFDADLVAELEEAAERSGRRAHLDALGPAAADALAGRVAAARYPHRLGTTLPGRWARSVDDAEHAVERGVAVRVVKGQWADTAGPDIDARDGFLGIVDRLRGHVGGVAVATHDVPLLAEALRRLTDTGTPCEMELFLGLPFDGPARVARRLGVPIRVYVPYGAAGAPYQLGALRRDPAVAWWLAQDLLLGETKTWRRISRSATRS